jgi:hypothetical protein
LAAIPVAAVLSATLQQFFTAKEIRDHRRLTGPPNRKADLHCQRAVGAGW